MKKLMRTMLNGVGLDIVRLKNSHETLEKHLSNVLASRNIDCILDVGANAGQYGVFLRSLGYDGYIVSFEPVAAVFAALKKTAESDSKWRCFDFALGEREETKTLNVYKSTVFSSFLPANAYSKGIWSSLEEVRPETVRVRRLDDAFDEVTQGLSASRFMLKLDTQGFDRFAFRGASGVRDRLQVLQSELSLIPVYEGMPPAFEVLKDYADAGFHISGMYPINRDESFAVIEYDCVMVRKG